MHDGREQSRQSDGGTHSFGNRSLAQPDFRTGLQIGGHAAKRRSKLFHAFVHKVFAPEVDDLFALEQTAAEVQIHEAEDLAFAQAQHPFLKAIHLTGRIGCPHQ